MSSPTVDVAEEAEARPWPRSSRTRAMTDLILGWSGATPARTRPKGVGRRVEHVDLHRRAPWRSAGARRRRSRRGRSRRRRLAADSRVCPQGWSWVWAGLRPAGSTAVGDYRRRASAGGHRGAQTSSTPGHPGAGVLSPIIRAGHERFDFVVCRRAGSTRTCGRSWSGAARRPLGPRRREFSGPSSTPPRRMTLSRLDVDVVHTTLLPAGDPEPGRSRDDELVPGRATTRRREGGRPVRTASPGARRAPSHLGLERFTYRPPRTRIAEVETPAAKADGRAPLPRAAGGAHTARLRHRALQAGPRSCGRRCVPSSARRGRGGRPVRGPQPARSRASTWRSRDWPMPAAAAPS